MARTGISILREIAQVNSAAIKPAIKKALLDELNAELERLYYRPPEVQTNLALDTAAEAAPPAPAGKPRRGA